MERVKVRRLSGSSVRVAAVVLVVLGVLASVMLFTDEHALLKRVLAAASDARPATPSKACHNPCGNGRLFLL